jgi:hypothetical protein
MRILKTLLIFMVLVIALTACYLDDDDFSTVVKEEETLTFEGVNQLKLSNVTGSIEVNGWDQDRVEITYRKKAANDTLLKKLLVSARHDGRVLDIDTHYPKRCRRCAISFKVYIPRSMEKIDITTVTGSVELAGLDHVEQASASTVTGSVKAVLSCRDCDFGSVTGSIRAEFNKIDEGGEISASLTTGSVRLYLPDDFSGKVRLHTVTGSLHTDFPITLGGTLKRTRIEGSIGEGSSRIKADTVTGSISLLKK